MATAPSPNDLTRQQLDELDALLQRMLSVPLTPTETPAPANRPGGAPQPVAWRAEPPAVPSEVSSPPVMPPSLALALEAVPAPPPAPVPAPPISPKPTTVPPPPPPVAKLEAKVPPAPEPPPSSPAPNPPVPPVVAAPPAPASPPAPVALTPAPTSTSTTGLTPVPTAPPVPFPLLPLVALNALFDGVCGLLGPPGRLLRSGLLKQVYGVTGLGLLIYTAAHVGQIRGWITLPVQVPWPR